MWAFSTSTIRSYEGTTFSPFLYGALLAPRSRHQSLMFARVSERATGTRECSPAPAWKFATEAAGAIASSATLVIGVVPSRVRNVLALRGRIIVPVQPA
jgi:hypothetical protein